MEVSIYFSLGLLVGALLATLRAKRVINRRIDEVLSHAIFLKKRRFDRLRALEGQQFELSEPYFGSREEKDSWLN